MTNPVFLIERLEDAYDRDLITQTINIHISKPSIKFRTALFYVKINSYHFILAPYLSSIPQGSVLDMLLWTNQLMHGIIKVSIALFLQTNKIYVQLTPRSYERIMTQFQLIQFAANEKYPFDFGSHSRSRCFEHNQYTINPVVNHKDFRILRSFQCSLTNHHIVVAKKAFSTLTMLKRSILKLHINFFIHL